MRIPIPYRRQFTPERAVRKLNAALRREFRRQLRDLFFASPQQAEERLRMLGSFARLRTEVAGLASESPANLSTNIERWTVGLWSERNAGVLTDDLMLGRVLMRLARARRAIGPVAPTQSESARVVVPTDLLFELHQMLFPAERMAVIAGRQIGGQLVLGACFDVTSRESSRVAYTRADPARLAEALRAMDASGTRLMAWAHSHPGETSMATFPSDIDRKQWAAWSEDFDPLLGLILTADGCVRFWGDAFETERLQLRFAGDGHRRIDHHVYRIAR